MLKLYSIYGEDSKVKIIIMKGEGKAFCSGRDLAAFLHHIRKGEYLYLTGARLDSLEMHARCLATHFVFSDKLDMLEDSLVEANASNSLTVGGIINKFSQHMPPTNSSEYNR